MMTLEASFEDNPGRADEGFPKGRPSDRHRRDALQRMAVGAALGPLLLMPQMPAWAHHGWSSFDLERPLYLHGRAVEVKWRNPHAELVLERSGAPLPGDLARRSVPPQIAQVDGAGLLAKARLPQRGDGRWMVELAPLTRMGQWKIPEITAGTELSVRGFTFAGEKGEPVLRAEYLFLGSAIYGLRSSPA